MLFGDSFAGHYEPAVDIFGKEANFNIHSIFTPEHGLKGNFSAGEKISDIFNKDIGINIISLWRL